MPLVFTTVVIIKVQALILVKLVVGEIRVWDLRKDDWEIADSSGEHGMHVVQVGWCSDKTCFSAYADGSIVVRKISSTNRTAVVLERLVDKFKSSIKL